MRLLRSYSPIICLWLLVVAAATAVTLHGQAQERERLFERFQLRSDTGASFVGAYVDDIFKAESRLATQVADPSWRPSEFVASSRLLGFSTSVLLDRQGRAVAVAPPAPELEGTQLANRYPHLSGALAGRPTASDVVPSAAHGKPTVAFAVPLPSGRYGALSMGFSLEEGPLYAFLERQPIAGTRGYIIDSTGATIVSSGGFAAPTVVKPSRLASALDQPTVVEGRLLAASRIPGTPWTYLLDAPETAVLIPMTTDDGSQWGLLGTLALLCLGGMLVTRRAMASRGQARAEKAQLDHRLSLTVQHAPIGMAMLGLDHRFIEPNAHLCNMLGYSGDELAATTLEEVTHGENVDQDLASLAQLTAGDIDNYEREQRYVRRDGTLLWGRLAVSVVRDDEGAPLYFVVQIEDVTEFRAAQAELEYRALYDPLTGLANRSLLMDRLANTLPVSRRPGHVGIGFCDVDDFKQINDTHGHHAGDEVLKEVARRLRGAVREGDTVARMGGDEFILLLTDVDSLLDAEGVMERASRAIAQPIMVDGVALRVGLSRGLALSRSGVSADTLLRNADAALYAAKKNGRGGCVVYHALLEGASDHLEEALIPNDLSPAQVETHIPEYGRSRLEELIQEALEKDAIHVAYQPVFDLSTGMIVGAEALLRLTDRDGQPVPPLQVIPAAEASGQIIEIGRRVLQLAAEQSARWRDEHGVLLPVAVNVSAAQLNLPGFPAHVLDAVERAGVPPEALVIELTESVMLRTGSGGVQQLSELRDAGIELAIDDFGTGYASLSLLHELPAATLKIDQSFISGIPHDHRAVAIVASVIELSQSLGMYCIAEGIETETQRAYLVEHGVLGQGFLLGRPDDDASISRILARDGMGDPWGRRAAHAELQGAIPATLKNPAGV